MVIWELGDPKASYPKPIGGIIITRSIKERGLSSIENGTLIVLGAIRSYWCGKKKKINNINRP